MTSLLDVKNAEQPTLPHLHKRLRSSTERHRLQRRCIEARLSRPVDVLRCSLAPDVVARQISLAVEEGDRNAFVQRSSQRLHKILRSLQPIAIKVSHANTPAACPTKGVQASAVPSAVHANVQGFRGRFLQHPSRKCAVIVIVAAAALQLLYSVIVEIWGEPKLLPDCTVSSVP